MVAFVREVGSQYTMTFFTKSADPLMSYSVIESRVVCSFLLRFSNQKNYILIS